MNVYVATPSKLTGMQLKLEGTKNPNWWEAVHLAI